MKATSEGVLENSEIFFPTASSTANQLLYTIHSAGEFHCGPEYRMARGIHPEVPVHDSSQVIYVEDGQGQVIIGGITRSVKAGDIVIMDCREPHSYRSNGYWHTLWVHYTGANSRLLTNAIIERWGPITSADNRSGVPRYLKLVLDCLRKQGPIQEPLLSGYIYNTLMELLAGSAIDAYIAPSIVELINYIETNYQNTITVDDLANRIAMSPSHLTRSFKNALGYSPYEYILKTRIDAAKNLLKCTDLSISEIGLQSGFSDESHFVATFRKKTGMTPREFRHFGV